MGLILFPLAASVTAVGLWQEKKKKFGVMYRARKFLIPVIVVASFIVGFYYFSNFHALIYSRAGVYNSLDVGLGAVALIVGLYLAYKTGSWFMCIFAIFMVVYMYLGPMLPGPLRHLGYTPRAIVSALTASLDRGVFGSLWVMLISYVSMLCIFSGLFIHYGGAEVIAIAVRRLIKRSPGLAPEGCVAGSALMGMVSGTPPAIITALAPVFLPIMDKVRIPRTRSAAILAVGAAGGNIMPPIMGAAAFLMVVFLGKSYLYISSHAFPVALIFFLTVAFATWLIYARSIETKQASTPAIEEAVVAINWERLVGQSVVIVGGIVVLVALLVLGFAIPYATRFMVLVVMGMGLVSYLFYNRKQGLIAGLKEFGQRTVKGWIAGGRSLGSIMMMIFPLTVIIVAMGITGLSIKLTNALVMLGADNLLFVAVMTALLCLLFGCAVSTVGVYMIVGVLLAPALVKLGIPPFCAHMFVFYYALLSNLTPPVAVSSVVAASVAECSFVKVCGNAITIGLPLFIFPFMFILYPNILLFDDPMSAVLILLLLAVAFFGFAYAFYSGGRLPKRVLFGCMGVGILLHTFVGLWFGIVLAVAMVMIMLIPWYRQRRQAARPVAG